MDFRNRHLLSLAKSQVSQKNRGVEGESIHILWTSCIDLASSSKFCTLCFGFARGLINSISTLNPFCTMKMTDGDNGDTHQTQKLFTLFVVFTRHSHLSSGKLVNIFGCTSLLCFFFSFFSFFSASETFSKLYSKSVITACSAIWCTHDWALELWGFTVKDITRFDTMIYHSYSSVKETHQVTWIIVSKEKSLSLVALHTSSRLHFHSSAFDRLVV